MSGSKSQMSRSQQAMTRKTRWIQYNIFVTIGTNFTKIRSHNVPGSGDILIRFSGQKVKGQDSRVKVTAGVGITVDGRPSSPPSCILALWFEIAYSRPLLGIFPRSDVIYRPNPKRHLLAWKHVVWVIKRGNRSRVWP